MLTHNNWLSSNIKERLKNKETPLQVTLLPEKITTNSFEEAAELVLQSIPKQNLYLALSGGTDSDYVFYLLIKNNIKFTPIIVYYEANSLEFQYAMHSCAQNNIKPIIISLMEDNYIKLLIKKVYMEIGGKAIYSLASILIGEYVKDNKGLVITGQDFICGDRYNCNMEFNVHDFYIDSIDDTIEIPFFLYNTDILYHAIKLYKRTMSVSEWKYNILFNKKVDFRPKIISDSWSNKNNNLNSMYYLSKLTGFNNNPISVAPAERADILSKLKNQQKIILNAEPI